MGRRTKPRPPSSAEAPRPLTGSNSRWYFISQALYTAEKRSASKRDSLTLGKRPAMPVGASHAGAGSPLARDCAWDITRAYWRAVTSYLPMKYSIGLSGVLASVFGIKGAMTLFQSFGKSLRVNWPLMKSRR